MKHIFIEEMISPADTIIDIYLKNCKPFSKIKVTATTTSYYSINAPQYLSLETTWQSTSTFISDGNGEVILNNCPSVSGDFKGVFPMGILSFMKPIKKRRSKIKYKNQVEYNSSFNVLIKIYEDNKQIDSCEITRYFKEKQTASINITMCEKAKATLYLPKSKKKLPAIIVLSGSEGGINKAQCIAQMISNYGIATMAIGYFGMNGLPKNLEKIPLEIVKEAIDILKNNKNIDSKRVGIYGRSKGAEFALIAATKFEDLSCIILNSPSIFVLEGVKGRFPSNSSSWVFKGKEIDYFEFKATEYLKAKIKKELYPNPNIEISARMPLEQLNGNILLLSSVHDEIWPAYQSSLKIKEELKQKNFSYNVTLKKYKYVGHMLTIPFQPNNRYLNKELVMKDTIESWQTTINYLKNYL